MSARLRARDIPTPVKRRASRVAPHPQLVALRRSKVGSDPIYFAIPVAKNCELSLQHPGCALVSDKKQEDLTTSICQAALRRFSESDDSLAGIIEQYEIKVRDFMLLSLLCDQESFDDDQLERALGLDRQSISHCIGRLDEAGLVKRNGFGSDGGRLAEVRTTAAGRVLAQRIFDCMN